jgi:peptidoglycan/LPS O-acetylase OafA/YrhL
MIAIIICVGIVAILAAGWLLNTFTDTMFRKAQDRRIGRQQVSETERVRQHIQERRRQADD